MNPAKKLKSVEPDLEVEVGPEKKIYTYCSVFLAYCSSYVDSMLASPMQEHQTKRITFPEIPSDTWDKMMMFLKEGGEEMSFEDAAEVIPFYDKYQFEDGVKIVEKAVACEVSSTSAKMLTLMQENKRFLSLAHHPMALLIERLKLSEQYSLEKTKKACIDSLVPVFHDDKARLMIYVRHWLYLAKFVVQDDRLWDPVADVLRQVGEADKESFVAASRDTGPESSTVIFKLLRALFEKEYAKTEGVRFP